MTDATCTRTLAAILSAESQLGSAVRRAMKAYLGLTGDQVLPRDGSVQPNRLPGDHVWHNAVDTWVLPVLATAWHKRFSGCAGAEAPDAARSYLASAAVRLYSSAWMREVDQMVSDVAMQAATRDVAREDVGVMLNVETWNDWQTRIARTEALSAVNSATLAAARTQKGHATLAKEWVSMRDELVRTTHKPVTGADGQTVGLDEDFVVGGHRGGYPGDPRLPAQEAINCRCVLRIKQL